MEIFKKRIKEVQNVLVDRGENAIFITNSVNIEYLIGYPRNITGEREIFLLCTKGNLYVLGPKMFLEEIKVEDVVGMEVVILNRKRSLGDVISEIVSKSDALLFEEEDLKVLEMNNLKKNFKGDLKQSKGLVRELRSVKDEAEIALIADAVRATDHLYSHLTKFIQNSGRISEFDIRVEIERYCLDQYDCLLAFEPIVAFKSGGSIPHYKCSGQVFISGNGSLLLDIGIRKQGYNGDLTRVLSIGKLKSKEKDIYKIVEECRVMCIEKCRPGVSFKNIHKEAIRIFSKYSLDKYFIHAIGHGIGLEVHESPFVRKDGGVFQEGMTLTIEPGLYFKREFGIRMEDVVLITKTGARVLTDTSYKYLEL